MIDELNARFGRPGVRFITGPGNFPVAQLTSKESTAQVCLYGAHVLHFQKRDEPPLLFLSGSSFFAEGKPIRGGVPVIFPWFGPRDGTDKTQMHGFVRSMQWDVCNTSQHDKSVSVWLRLQSSDATRRIWPHNFEAQFGVGISSHLRMYLRIRNTSNQPFTFENALHTYFAVGDIAQIRIDGLADHVYRDRSVSPDPQVDDAEAITFTRRIDRVYRDACGTVLIHDPLLKRQVIIAKQNSATTVVWNPAASAPGEFPDLGPEDYRHFVCVETANAREKSITLAPGETHDMKASILSRT